MSLIRLNLGVQNKNEKQVVLLESKSVENDAEDFLNSIWLYTFHNFEDHC